MRKTLILWLGMAGLFGAVSFPAYADRYELESGQVYEGTVVMQDDSSVVLMTSSGGIVNVKKSELKNNPSGQAGSGASSEFVYPEFQVPDLKIPELNLNPKTAATTSGNPAQEFLPGQGTNALMQYVQEMQKKWAAIHKCWEGFLGAGTMKKNKKPTRISLRN